MKARRFNPIISKVNEKWGAKMLNMRVNQGNGPDLIDSEKVVEVKFRLIHPEKYTHLHWTILGYQFNYEQQAQEQGKNAFWAMGFYTLNQPVSKIRTNKIEKLESLILERELFIIKWDWANQFSLYLSKGKTKKSVWNHYLTSAKAKALPHTTNTYNVEKGKIHITKGVNPKAFNIKTI